MAFGKITVLIFPDGANTVKQLRVPRFLIVLFILLLASGGAFISWILRDYQTIKPKMLHLAQLEKENLQQKRQLIHLAGRINQIAQQLDGLQEFESKLKAMVDLETSDDNSAFHGVGGSDPNLFQPDYSMAKTHQELARLMHRSLDTLDNEIAADKQDKTKLYEFLENQKKLLACTPSIWPTRGWLSSRFAYRISPFTQQREFHRGVDISTRMNAPIVAPANGVVTSIRKDRLSGNVLTLNHGYGLVTKYAHLQKALVKKGQYVSRGETIALVGSTGRSTGPHLHYEVHLNGVPVNPLRYILN